MSYETEEQQVEALKSWWDENGRAIIAGIVLGAGAIGGWTLWQNHTESQAIAASDTFTEVLSAVRAGENASVAPLTDELVDDQSGSLYAAYAQLAAALAAVREGDLDTAAERLRWVADEADQEYINLIANVRLARVELARGNVDAALAALPDAYPEGFTGLVEEARGDAHVANDNASAARTAYQRAQDSQNVADANALSMKLTDLAVAADPS